MQMGRQKKTLDSGHFRQENMTSWSKSHPVMFPHFCTDHWSKMKTMVPDYLALIPVAFIKDLGTLNWNTSSSSNRLPPLVLDETTASKCVPSLLQQHCLYQNTQKTLPQNMPKYRNVFNDRARRNFCYWLAEKKTFACKGNNFGAYKTALGLPKV